MDILALYVSRSGSYWLRVTPFGIRRIVNWIRKEYGDVPIYITENGVSDKNGTLADTCRVNYYKRYLNELLKGKCCLFRVQRLYNFTVIVFSPIVNVNEV